MMNTNSVMCLSREHSDQKPPQLKKNMKKTTLKSKTSQHLQHEPSHYYLRNLLVAKPNVQPAKVDRKWWVDGTWSSWNLIASSCDDFTILNPERLPKKKGVSWVMMTVQESWLSWWLVLTPPGIFPILPTPASPGVTPPTRMAGNSAPGTRPPSESSLKRRPTKPLPERIKWFVRIPWFGVMLVIWGVLDVLAPFLNLGCLV